MMNNDLKVSVIVTAHNYAKYLPKCLDSVLSQQYVSYELIVVNDGSKDDTEEIVQNYKKQFADKINAIKLVGVGLAKACNIGIKVSRGKYIIRLDADDYFDENILLVESNILDSDQNIHMVYPDYYTINKYGEILDSVRLLKANDEVKLLDRSPLAAGAMFRRECFDLIGGYDERLKYQEDYDFWIRFVDKFNVYNVNLPLMYYRKHNLNMSNNFHARMEARRHVKRKIVEKKKDILEKNIIAVIPAMGLFRNREKMAIKPLGGKPLISYTIEEALKCELIDRVIVSTEDQEIASIATKYGAEIPFLRPMELARTNVSVDDVIRHMFTVFSKDGEVIPDIVIVLPYIAPFRKEKHIREAINTFFLYDIDSVIGVITDVTFHWKPGEYGLEPIGYKKRTLREDKETIYKESGSIYVIKSSVLKAGKFIGEKVGHIEMSQKEGWRIEDDFGFSVAEKIMEENGL